MIEFDPDETRLASDSLTDAVCPSGQPWEMPEFTLDEAQAIGKIAGDLVESGDWAEIEDRIKSRVGKITL